LILGEAIADIGGLELAVEALRSKDLFDDIKKEVQKLFINAATFERSVRREESMDIMAKTDPHPPGIFRVNCVVSHINSFYDAFDVTETDKLYLPPEKRAHIW
jgi:putative endopeptidase